MNKTSLLLEWFWDLGPWLRRVFWHPLRQILDIFHILPLLAALTVFGLFAGDGQVREIYLSYLEDLKSDPAWSVVSLAAAAIGVALISAVLFESHYLLSTMRINVIYSSNAKPGVGSRLRGLQRDAAIALALSPWAGIVVGLFRTRLYLEDTVGRLIDTASAGFQPPQFMPTPDRLAIASCVVGLGVAASLYVDADPQVQSPQRTAMALRPLAAVIFALLLVDALQTSLDVPLVTGVFVGLGIAGLTVIYYFAYYWLHKRKFHFLYAHLINRDTGVYLQRRQRLLLFCWALLPWLVVALYLCFWPPPTTKNGQNTWTIVPVMMCAVTAAGLLVALVLYRVRESTKLFWTIVVTTGVLAVLGLFVSRFDADKIIAIYRFIGPLGSLAFGLLFLISIFVVLALLSVRSGFPALMLVTASLIISAIFPVPIGITAFGLGVICALLGIAAAVSRLGFVSAVAFLLTVPGAINFLHLRGITPVDLYSTPQGKSVRDGFECWLDSRGVTEAGTDNAGCTNAPTAAGAVAATTNANHKYPVFIIAVEGGGIYAASAAALLLAKLQDADSSFARHVFAISGVSGGAIGATLFKALEQARIREAPAANGTTASASTATSIPVAVGSSDPVPVGCGLHAFGTAKRATNLSLTDEVSAVLQTDHFSPVVATIFPEILGLSFCTRPDALVASFEQAATQQDATAGRILDAPFAKSWSEGSQTPALVLNATWAETGFRAAFAPFHLHDIDDSLYSFDDQNMPIEPAISLMNAAVVSARFPGILPPYSVSIKERPNHNGNPTQAGRSSGQNKQTTSTPPTPPFRWNFVDGGYSDSSGAATALAIYEKLKPVADKHNAKLRIILLTSSNPPRNPDQIQGTEFGDIVAPMDAVLSVREGLSNEAVARACNGVLGGECNDPTNVDPCKPLVTHAEEPALQIVGLPNETYKLPLGWKLSQTTFSVVRWMIGTPHAGGQLQQAQPAQNNKNQASQPIVQPPSASTAQQDSTIAAQNSCVLDGILQTLGKWQQTPNQP